MDQFFVDPKSKRIIEMVVREVLAGKISTRPVATRRTPRMSGGGSKLRWGQATSAISAATGWAEADRGSGSVQFYDDAGDPDGDPIDVESMFWDVFDDDSVVCVDTSFTPARVISVGCTVVT